MGNLSTSIKSTRIKKILKFCKEDFRSLADISNALGGLNKNTLRSGYLYPLYRDGILIRNTDAVKKGIRYKTK